MSERVLLFPGPPGSVNQWLLSMAVPVVRALRPPRIPKPTCVHIYIERERESFFLIFVECVYACVCVCVPGTGKRSGWSGLQISQNLKITIASPTKRIDQKVKVKASDCS